MRTFLGNLFGGGTVSETINTDPDEILTYSLSSIFQDLTSVSITAELPMMGISISNDAGVTDDFDYIVATQFDGGPAVPEPSTWALMISGFGLAGAALRRRRTVVAAWGAADFGAPPVFGSAALLRPATNVQIDPLGPVSPIVDGDILDFSPPPGRVMVNVVSPANSAPEWRTEPWTWPSISLIPEAARWRIPESRLAGSPTEGRA